MNMDNIMERIEVIKNKLNQLQEELKNTSVTATDEDNFVTAVVNGRGKITDYQFTLDLVKSISEKEFVLALVQATNKALEKAREIEIEKKKDIVGDVNIPDMPGLF